jgi:hypothetical protein
MRSLINLASIILLLAWTCCHLGRAQYLEEHGKTREVVLREALVTDWNEFLPSLRQQSPQAASQTVLRHLFGGSLEDRLTRLFHKARTSECRAKIAQHFGYFVNALGEEEDLPFSNIDFNNTCPEPVYHSWDDLPEGMHIGHVQNRTYQPPRNETEYIQNASDLRLMYAILTHDAPHSTIRIIENLYEPGRQGSE